MKAESERRRRAQEEAVKSPRTAGLMRSLVVDNWPLADG